MSLTDNNTYFEDFVIGDIYLHSRGKTITDTEHQWLTHLVMNTAQVHFNQAMVEADPKTLDSLVSVSPGTSALSLTQRVFRGIFPRSASRGPHPRSPHRHPGSTGKMP